MSIYSFSRINREIKKKHLTSKQRAIFSKELSMVFRKHDDTGPERTLPTTSAQVITKRLKELRQNWEDSIPQKATHQINNLLVHAEKGCLRWSLVTFIFII